ncbi:methyltransferase family protein [Thermoactinomyces mirandus]|uniref:methyltransferase family protein n=1 Tax=Thermoactinomyces mirandus TaxID=2756294 RepID=UPI0015EE8317|nr:methyltransferase [Thermoactinomyces mirandus]
MLPTNPTQNLVVAGPYQYVRNPMYCGVIFVLSGEAILLGSIYLLGWFFLFWLFHLVILFFEEPGLVKRFGEEYVICGKMCTDGFHV